MNIGFVIIVDEEDAQKTINAIKKHKNAFKIGYAKEDFEETITIKAFDGSIINL